MSKKPKIIAVVGPTASGKSELAVRLARKFGGEIISADSRQIYRGLDIGSAKVPGKWKTAGGKKLFIYKSIPHHCIDIVPPKNIFTAAEFKDLARSAIQDILGHAKLPVIAGGTGFWLDALIYGMHLPEVPPDMKLRKKLAQKTTDELFILLKKLDPKRALTVDRKNPRRLIRAIEIAETLGKVPAISLSPSYRTLWLGLAASDARLEKNIRIRTRRMLDAGLIQETRKLMRRKIPRRRILEFGFEYGAALDFLDKKISPQELYGRIVRDTLNYVKRQMRWWKRNKKISWIKSRKQAEKLSADFLSIPRKRHKIKPNRG